MNFDYSKRGYLLPKGCKDLIDVLNQQAPTIPSFAAVVTASNYCVKAWQHVMYGSLAVYQLLGLSQIKWPFFDYRLLSSAWV